jgi:hypothetical protein
MNKTKLLAFFAISAIFLACGSQDGSEPALKSNNLIISPFDTLKAEFNSRIVNIIEDDIVINNGKMLKNDNNAIYFIGNNTTPGGSIYFDGGLINAPVTFKKYSLENSDGYKNGEITLNFSTYSIRDTEPNDDPDSSGVAILTGNEITFAGVLDHIITRNSSGDVLGTKRDVADYYKLNLRVGKNLKIKASNKTTPFKIVFSAICKDTEDPKNNCNNDTLKINNRKDSISVQTKLGHWQDGDIMGSEKTFYLKVFDENNDISNPYLITVEIP